MTNFVDQEKPSLAELAHHGVKGMHWGVRKDDGSAGSSGAPSRFTPEQKAAAKKVALGVGILAAVAGAAFVGVKLSQNGSLPISTLRSAAETSKGAEAAKGMLKEQTEMIHATRGRNVGFSFLKTGGIPNALETYEATFGTDNGEVGIFKHLPDGRIAASFHDPGGAKDFAGRTIPHQIIIPKTMTDGINNLDDVKSKIYTPLLKDAFDANYVRTPKGA